MKKIWILTLLAMAAVSLSGCSSCGSGGGLFRNWFNRGDNCGPPPCASNVGGGAPYGVGSPVMLAPAEAGPAFIPAGQ